MRFSRFSKMTSIVFAAGCLSVGINAQANKTKAKPLATPLPVLSAAEIISRAGDYTIPPPTVELPSEVASEQTPPTDSERIKALNDRIKKLETAKKDDYDEKQKRMLLNLDILTRAEQRSESLRKQLFEMIDKENTVKSRLEQIEIDIRPEAIERILQLAGSMKPEEVRDSRRKSLEAERRNLQSLMTEIQNTRVNINFNLQKAEVMVEKLRTKLEKDIDDSFLTDNND